jgi:hypothetical protein
MPELGSTRENPIYFRFLRDEELKLDWRKIATMLALTALSGYLATASQRAGSRPDGLKMARMYYHATAGKLAAKQTEFWRGVYKHHADLYEIARL